MSADPLARIVRATTDSLAAVDPLGVRVRGVRVSDILLPGVRTRPVRPRAARGPSFRRDTRAIEGLPVRLVIALVVGVASLSVMMNMLAGVQGLAVTELDVRPQPEVVFPGEQEITFTVVGSDGDPVEDATIVVKGGTAVLDEIPHAETDAAGNATVSVAPELRANQDEGTLTVSIKPPAGSQFADRRQNTVVLVIRG